MSKTKPFGADRCPNCGEYGQHFAGPSFGEPGFFICKKKPKSEAENEQANPADPICGTCKGEGQIPCPDGFAICKEC